MKPAAADSAVAGFVSTPAVSFCICRSTSNCGIIINFRAGIFESHVADRAPVSPLSTAAPRRRTPCLTTTTRTTTAPNLTLTTAPLAQPARTARKTNAVAKEPTPQQEACKDPAATLHSVDDISCTRLFSLLTCRGAAGDGTAGVAGGIFTAASSALIVDLSTGNCDGRGWRRQL